MTVTAASSADVDLFADEVLVDPYPTYARLRDLGAVVHLRRNDIYVLTRYDVIRAAVGDWESFSSVGAIGFNPMVNDALAGTSLASDPPTHTRLRATLTANLSPRALRGLKTRIDAKADALVADLVEKGSFEAIDALARAFPVDVVLLSEGFSSSYPRERVYDDRCVVLASPDTPPEATALDLLTTQPHIVVDTERRLCGPR